MRSAAAACCCCCLLLQPACLLAAGARLRLLEQRAVLALREHHELVVGVQVERFAEERRLVLLDRVAVQHAAQHLDHLAAVVAARLRPHVHQLPVLLASRPPPPLAAAQSPESPDRRSHRRPQLHTAGLAALHGAHQRHGAADVRGHRLLVDARRRRGHRRGSVHARSGPSLARSVCQLCVRVPAIFRVR